MHFLLCKIIIILTLIMPITAYADVPTLEGEDLFNQTVERSMTGDLSLNPTDILNMLSDDIMGEIRECTDDVIILFIIAAISGIITTISTSFGNKSTSEAAFFACFTLMSAAAIKCFGSGKAVSASTFQPVMSAAVYVVSIIIEKCLVPLIAFSSVLAVAGNISDKVQLSGFCKVVKSISKWLMAAIITIFTGISAIYGFSSPALDAVSGKAVKFAVGSLVPVVGTFLSDTLETVVSGTRLMKNAVGTSGIIVMCVICVLPILKIGVIQLMLKLTSSIAEPLTDKRVSSMLWEVSESVTTIFAVVVMVAVLFMINISIMITSTGI